jgi:hypothetical protein
VLNQASLKRQRFLASLKHGSPQRSIMLLLITLCVLLAVVSATESYLDIHLQTIKTIFLAAKGEIDVANLPAKLPEDFVVTANDVKLLLELHDGDSHCGYPCVSYITEKLMDGKSFMQWSFFQEMITKIYGNQITSDPFQPQELHIALTSDFSAMNVMFVTMQELQNSFVQWLPAADSAGAAADVDWSTAQQAPTATSTYRVPQKWWPIFTGTIYSSEMTSLKNDAYYTYRVGGVAPDGTTKYSPVYTFKAAPVVDASRKTVVATLADHGTFELLGWKTVQVLKEKLQEYAIDLVHVAGDLSYAGLSTEMKVLHVGKEDEFEHVWDLLAIQNEPVAAAVPWMVTNGNHERFYDWAAYMNRFTMPKNPDLLSNGSFWYTYEYGNSRWISISSEHDLSEGSPQRTFLIAALEFSVARRDVVPWIVVSIHKPMYCSCDGWGISPYRAQLESLMIQYDVDLMLNGHLHAYERVHPVKDGIVTVFPDKMKTSARETVDVYRSTGQGPVIVVQGNTGGMQGETWMQPQPEWSAVRMANGFIPKNNTESALDGRGKQHDISIRGIVEEIKKLKDYHYVDTYGFGVATFVNATHMYYQSIPVAHTIGYDSFWVVKRT